MAKLLQGELAYFSLVHLMVPFLLWAISDPKQDPNSSPATGTNKKRAGTYTVDLVGVYPALGAYFWCIIPRPLSKSITQTTPQNR